MNENPDNEEVHELGSKLKDIAIFSQGRIRKDEITYFVESKHLAPLKETLLIGALHKKIDLDPLEDAGVEGVDCVQVSGFEASYLINSGFPEDRMYVLDLFDIPISLKKYHLSLK